MARKEIFIERYPLRSIMSWFDVVKRGSDYDSYIMDLAIDLNDELGEHIDVGNVKDAVEDGRISRALRTMSPDEVFDEYPVEKAALIEAIKDEISELRMHARDKREERMSTTSEDDSKFDGSQLWWK